MWIKDVILDGLRNIVDRDGLFVDVLRSDGGRYVLNFRLGQDVDLVVLVPPSLVAVPPGAVAPELKAGVTVAVLDRAKELVDSDCLDPLAFDLDRIALDINSDIYLFVAVALRTHAAPPVHFEICRTASGGVTYLVELRFFWASSENAA